MGYIIAPKEVAVVEHASSKKQATVQLTQIGTPASVSKPTFKEDSESFNATFEGSFQIDVGAGRAIAGKLTVIVQYSSDLDGPQVGGIVGSSLTLLSCECERECECECRVVELPEFVIQEVEDTY